MGSYDFIIIVISAVLIWAILRFGSITKPPSEEGSYARASDVYNKLLTNDNNLFKLMTDFSQPVPIFGPGGVESESVETSDISLLNRLAL